GPDVARASASASVRSANLTKQGRGRNRALTPVRYGRSKFTTRKGATNESNERRNGTGEAGIFDCGDGGDGQRHGLGGGRPASRSYRAGRYGGASTSSRAATTGAAAGGASGGRGAAARRDADGHRGADDAPARLQEDQ